MKKFISVRSGITFILLLFMSFVLNAQNEGSSLKGRLIDPDGEPLLYADVVLFSAEDSSFLDGVATDESGNFLLEGIEAGAYYLMISYIGYEEKTISGISLGELSSTVDLGDVTIKMTAMSMAEIIVSGEKSLMEVHMDKKVFNVSKSIVSKGGNGLDVLRNIPSIDIDAEDNISLRGDQNVIILVDGRRIVMSPSDFLKMFSADAIDKVELITNPSAKYDPEGMSGIINVIMKKESVKGYSFKPNITIGHGTYPMTSLSVNMNYRKNKINLSATASTGYQESWFSGTAERSYKLGDSTFYQNSTDDGGYSGMSIFTKLGLDYYLNKKNTLYLSAGGWLSDFNTHRDLHYEDVTSQDLILIYSNRTADENGNRNGLSVNGGWQHKFKRDDHTLDFDGDLSMNVTDNAGVFEEHFFTGNDIELPIAEYQNTLNDDFNMILTNKLDYVNPLKQHTEYEAGFHSTTRKVRTGIDSETRASLLEEFQSDTNVNNKFNYDQQVYAVYNTFGHEIKKFSYKAGLRAEQTYTKSHLVNTKEDFVNNYFALFPSLHLTYEFSRKESMQLSYSRRLNRPRLQMLNPFPSFSDPYIVQVGNPYLKPEYVHVLEYGYNKSYDKANLNTSIFYRRITDLHRRFVSISPDGVTVVNFKNFESGDLSGAELIYSYNIKTWWRIRTTFNAWQSVINDGDLEQNLDFTNWGWSANLISTHPFREYYRLQISGRYMSGLELLQGKMKPMYWFDLALSRSFKDERTNLNLRITDPLNMRRFEFVSSDDLSYSFSTIHRFESRAVYLTFSYIFGNLGNAPDHDSDGDNEQGDDFNAPDMQ